MNLHSYSHSPVFSVRLLLCIVDHNLFIVFKFDLKTKFSGLFCGVKDFAHVEFNFKNFSHFKPL